MSFIIDVEYLNQIQHRLPLFRRTNTATWVCRCVICGDSQTNHKKTRGYFYRVENKLAYKCHNCGASKSFNSFLKAFDPIIYDQYRLSIFKDRMGERPHPPITENSHDINTPTQKHIGVQELLVSGARYIADISPTHPVKQYVRARAIPQQYYRYLLSIDSANKLAPVFGKKYENIKIADARLVIPFYTDSHELFAISMRSVEQTGFRYITMQQDRRPLVFGQERIDTSRRILVTEGPLDSLFLPNAIACAGTSFGSIETLGLDKHNITIVFDNQPRNKELMALMEKYIDLNYAMCIWPSYIKQKDINDMVIAGYKNVEQIIHQHTYQGMYAKTHFMQWKKVK